MGRAPCCEKVGLKKGRWSAQEDEILTKYIQANGEGSWRALPKNAGLLRCGKSCRLRWINYLRSDLKRGNISAHEEDLIIQLHSSLGNRWSQIASHLPGRTDNEIKNYWNSHLSRKIYAFRRPANSDTYNSNSETTKRKGGKTSRWAMKKNKSNKTQQEASEKPNHRQNNTVTITTVPEPTTPALEKEGLSIITSDDGIDFEDFMVLEGGGDNNNNAQDKVEEGGGELGDQEASNNSGESGDGSLKSSEGDKEIREERKEEKGNDEEGIDEGGELCLDDMLDTWLLQDHEGGVSSLTNEREILIHDDVSCFHSEKPSPHQPDHECTNTQNWFSSSPMPEYDYWHNWEISEDDLNKESQTWDDKQNLLSWLWEDDECQNITPQIDHEKQNPKLPLILS